MSYGADWICECRWANLDVRKTCRNCGKEPDWKARAVSAEAELTRLRESAGKVIEPFAREADVERYDRLVLGVDIDHWPLGDNNICLGHIRAARAWRDQNASPSQPRAEEGDDIERCPICAVPFKPDDMCATDIELGTCHAACLEGSPTVDLETGEPIEGPIPAFRYDE